MIIEPRMDIIFCMQFTLVSTHVLLVSILGATKNLIPLKYRCMIKVSNRIRQNHVELEDDFNV